MSQASDDQRWSRAVRDRDRRCQRCGKQTTLEAAHIFGRAIQATRHDTENGVTLCRDCHAWAHQHPAEFIAWAAAWMGQESFEALRVRARALEKRVPRSVA